MDFFSLPDQSKHLAKKRFDAQYAASGTDVHKPTVTSFFQRGFLDAMLGGAGFENINIAHDQICGRCFANTVAKLEKAKLLPANAYRGVAME